LLRNSTAALTMCRDVRRLGANAQELLRNFTAALTMCRDVRRLGTNAREALRNAYMGELEAHSIRATSEVLWPRVLHSALVNAIEILCWLLPQYFKVRDDPSFASWRQWAQGHIPLMSAYVRQDIADATIYRVV